jgi:hypothetical protein
MKENAKTLALLVIAVAVALFAWLGRPMEWAVSKSVDVGKPLTADFNPLLAASMEITEYDETTATVHPFEVAQVEFKGKRRWSIPSHSDYPADADKQVASAATALMGLKILSVEGESQADHEKFGVVNPDPKKLKPGAAGVGMKVALRDKNGKDLLSLIIGKEVPDQPGLRYVRRTGQDPIYTATVNTANLSTQFDRWIEKNLLKINAFDMQSVNIRDYSVDVLNRAVIQRNEMVLKYDDQAEPRWTLAEDRQFTEGGKWTPLKLKDDEELNAAKLDALKTALDDLKIVDVVPKPQGLSADLKTSADFLNKDESLLTLMSRGFIPAQMKNQVELFSKEGEVRLSMKDGAEYVLRFGDIATDSDAGPAKKDEADKEQKEAQDKDRKKSSTGRNRYLFVMAEFNPDAIPKPKFDPLPEAKPEAEKKEAAESKDAAKTEEKPAENKDAAKPEEKPADKDAEKSSLQADRELVEKENKRKQEEYDEKLAAGKKHADELNARFADWYYVISDDVYRKIRLGRDEIVIKKEKKDANAKEQGDVVPPMPAGPITDFENLQKQGPAGK